MGKQEEGRHDCRPFPVIQIVVRAAKARKSTG